MALSLTYHDSYLKPLITEERERRAIANVDALGTFPTTPVNWRERLAVIKSYLITCLESQASSEDVFSVKYKQYATEWTTVLGQAKAAAMQQSLQAIYLTWPIERA